VWLCRYLNTLVFIKRNNLNLEFLWYTLCRFATLFQEINGLSCTLMVTISTKLNCLLMHIKLNVIMDVCCFVQGILDHCERQELLQRIFEKVGEKIVLNYWKALRFLFISDQKHIFNRIKLA